MGENNLKLWQNLVQRLTELYEDYIKFILTERIAIVSLCTGNKCYIFYYINVIRLSALLNKLRGQLIIYIYIINCITEYKIRDISIFTINYI